MRRGRSIGVNKVLRKVVNERHDKGSPRMGTSNHRLLLGMYLYMVLRLQSVVHG